MVQKSLRKSFVKVLLMQGDDTVRDIIEQSLERDEHMKVVASVHGADKAIESAVRYQPDVVIMDAEMSIMQAIVAVPKIMDLCPYAKILLCTGYSKRGAEAAICALGLGAEDCMLKPKNDASREELFHFQYDLIRRVNILSGNVKDQNVLNKHYELREGAFASPPKVLALCGTTGVFIPLINTLRQLENLDLPILIPNYLPSGFSEYLVECLQIKTGLKCIEAYHGMEVRSGCVYVAPGGSLMSVENIDDTVHLNIKEVEDFDFSQQQAIDALLSSLPDAYGSEVLSIMLSGDGNDGLNGCREIVKHGGHVIAQDLSTSVSWEIPGAIVAAGLCSKVLPANELGDWIQNYVLEKAPFVEFDVSSVRAFI